MLEALQRIRSLITAKGANPLLGYVLVRAGRAYAGNGIVTASAPVDCPLEFLAPGEQLVKLLERMPAPEIAQDGPTIKVKCGRLRGTLQTLDPAGAPFLGPDAPWQPLPAGLCRALRLARPFVQAGDTWAASVCLDHGIVAAASGRALTRCAVPALVLDGERLLPPEAVDFVLGQETEPDRWVCLENYAAFAWPDGLWMRTQLLALRFHETAKTMPVGECTVVVNQQWREALENVAALSPEFVVIGPTSISGAEKQGQFDHGAELAVTGESKWNPEVLGRVIAIAERWEPGAYPKPVPFRGEGFEGVVLGRA